MDPASALPQQGDTASLTLPCRRSECYQCLRERSPSARVLGPEAAGIEEPSCILRVAGLAPGADEEALRFLFVPHAPGESGAVPAPAWACWVWTVRCMLCTLWWACCCQSGRAATRGWANWY